MIYNYISTCRFEQDDLHLNFTLLTLILYRVNIYVKILDSNVLCCMVQFSAWMVKK